jgi:hypothetical protein
MSRHSDFVPQGVIPAVLLPFHQDLSIDEPSFRAHLRDVGAVQGLSAITINAHSTEVASCTEDEQRRVMAITGEEVGDKLPIIHGVWADGSLQAARIARQAQASGASALLVFPPAPFTLGQSAEMALAHFKTIGDATDLPLIVFQYPLATGQGYPAATLERLFDEVPTIRAIKDWTPLVPQHESQIRALQGRAQQRMAFEFAGAGLQWPAFRQRQRHRRSSGQALSRRQGQRSRGSPPVERPDLSDGACVLRRSLHRHAQPHEGSAGAAWQTAARGGASAAGQDHRRGNCADPGSADGGRSAWRPNGAGPQRRIARQISA